MKVHSVCCCESLCHELAEVMISFRIKGSSLSLSEERADQRTSRPTLDFSLLPCPAWHLALQSSNFAPSQPFFEGKFHQNFKPHIEMALEYRVYKSNAAPLPQHILLTLMHRLLPRSLQELELPRLGVARQRS